MLIMSAKTPAAVTSAPAPSSLYHHRIFMITFSSQHYNVIAAPKVEERVAAPNLFQTDFRFAESRMATKRN